MVLGSSEPTLKKLPLWPLLLAHFEEKTSRAFLLSDEKYLILVPYQHCGSPLPPFALGAMDHCVSIRPTYGNKGNYSKYNTLSLFADKKHIQEGARAITVNTVLEAYM